jgi:hypothetical protein
MGKHGREMGKWMNLALISSCSQEGLQISGGQRLVAKIIYPTQSLGRVA